MVISKQNPAKEPGQCNTFVNFSISLVLGGFKDG